MRPIFQLYRIHQLVNNNGTCFPTKWDCVHLKWICPSIKIDKLAFKKYIATALAIKLFITVLGIIIIQIASTVPNVFEFYDVLAQAVMVIVILFSIVLDSFVLKHIDTLAHYNNWAHAAEKYYHLSRNDDLFMFKVVMAPNMCIFALIYTCVILYVYFDMDPFFNISKCLVYFMQSQYYLNYYQYLILKQIRLVVGFCVAHYIMVGILNLMLISISLGLHRCAFLKCLEKQVEPNEELINLYRQSIIVANAVKSFEYDISTLILSAVFVACIMFSNIFRFAVCKRMGIIVIASIGIIFFIVVVLDVLFVIGCSFYKSSFNVLNQWRNVTGRTSPHMYRVLKSLPIIALPAGKAGVIDTDIKVNYFYSLLVNTSNSILTVRSFM